MKIKEACIVAEHALGKRFVVLRLDLDVEKDDRLLAVQSGHSDQFIYILLALAHLWVDLQEGKWLIFDRLCPVDSCVGLGEE
ncbi:hypothetical protein CJ255_16685 [Candidatus Viridilinea mediisalina]|uniref:Uncharacterized protein n=1 Tax=Candidatus Viridilinea mediisalina TaxID=2024553 RepID=A0A2A6RG94_9CHLR|nr:hypothetical protein CJ255_16685 [Candidatus Viridilinea mediisalina]